MNATWPDTAFLRTVAGQKDAYFLRHVAVTWPGTAKTYIPSAHCGVSEGRHCGGPAVTAPEPDGTIAAADVDRGNQHLRHP